MPARKKLKQAYHSEKDWYSNAAHRNDDGIWFAEMEMVFVSGNIKVGLALGAGTSRGLAHIGVLEVLEEHGIPIDYIAGCSIGSIIGCMSASGATGKMIHSKAIEICSSNSGKLFDITFPSTGLIRGQQIKKLINTLTNDCDIEQLKTPFAALAACLEDGSIRIFDSGKTTDAVRASISVPGVFEPVVFEGKTYVDGGVLVRVPVEAVRNMGADFVIAVDVGYNGGFRTSPKNIVDVMIYSFELQQWEAMRGRQTGADAVIAPDTSSMNPAKFDRVEECIEVGRAAALLTIDDIQRALDKAACKAHGKRGIGKFLQKINFLKSKKPSTESLKTRW